MKGAIRKLLIFIGVIASAAVVLWLFNLRPVKNFSEKYAGTDLTVDAEGAVMEGTYNGYIREHENAGTPEHTVEIDLFSYTEGTGVEIYENYMGEEKALYSDTESLVTWEINVPEAGFYNVYLEYMTVESRGVAVERKIYINGELPFDDAENLTFSRIWTDAAEPRVDNQGNQIRPAQVEVYEWQSAYCRDDMGYVIEPYRFYFNKGKNTVSFEGVNEPVVLRKVLVSAVKELDTYTEYHAKGGNEASEKGRQYIQVLQGEDAVRRSEPSLYAKYDKASASTQPYSVMNTILNYTGGDAWRATGQWIEWEFTVPEDGYYSIMIKGRQNYARGLVACRSLYIDNEIPFAQMQEIGFAFGNDWNTLVLADENEVPYEFYLTEGTHTVRLEATLGGMGTILSDLQSSTYRLNQIYRLLCFFCHLFHMRNLALSSF